MKITTAKGNPTARNIRDLELSLFAADVWVDELGVMSLLEYQTSPSTKHELLLISRNYRLDYGSTYLITINLCSSTLYKRPRGS